jgi:hypothetical protein
MRIECDAGVGEIRIEGVAESFFRCEPHEGELGVVELLLRRRQAGVGGECRRGREEGDRRKDGFHGRFPTMVARVPAG